MAKVLQGVVSSHGRIVMILIILSSVKLLLTTAVNLCSLHHATDRQNITEIERIEAAGFELSPILLYMYTILTQVAQLEIRRY
jgi:hypothetical protein